MKESFGFKFAAGLAEHSEQKHFMNWSSSFPPRTDPPSAGMKIVYMHDDTETLKDAVTLRLTDGVHTVQGTAQVTVLLVNDEEPRLLKYTCTHKHTHKHTRAHTHTRVLEADLRI